MPLNEQEQRILREIEEHLQRDHSFARDLRPHPPTLRHGFLGWAAATVLLVAGAVFGMTVHPLLGFVSFVAAVSTGLVVESHLRDAGDQQLQDLADALRTRRDR